MSHASRYVCDVFKTHKDQHRLLTFNMPFAKQSYKVNSFKCLIKQAAYKIFFNRMVWTTRAWACIYITHELAKWTCNGSLRKCNVTGDCKRASVRGIKPVGPLKNYFSLDLDNISGGNVFFYITYEANDALDNHNSKVLSLFWG